MGTADGHSGLLHSGTEGGREESDRYKKIFNQFRPVNKTALQSS